MKIAVLNVATGKYINLVDQLHYSIRKNLMNEHDVDIFLFTDSQKDFPSDVKTYQIERRGWPGDTLYRYHYFLKAEEELKKYDFLLYLDVDLCIQSPIGDEIISNLVATEHPGFYGKENGTFERRRQSQAFVPMATSHPYYCGGVQGGKSEIYLKACAEIKQKIDIDDENGILAIWYDESHWNSYLKNFPPTLSLDPRYCYPTDAYFPWIQSFEKSAKIITVAKNEEEIRGK